MTLNLPSLDSFTIVLIGGPIVLGTGETIDTRIDYRTDPLCQVARQAASNSQLWWETAAGLVKAMVASTDHIDHAAVLGQRTVVNQDPDGRLRRQRLTSLLDGGVALVNEESVAKPLDEEHWLLTSLDLLEARRQNPSLRSNLIVSTDAAPFVIQYEGQELFTRFEALAVDGAVLIVPHTRIVERFLNAYVDYVNLGRAPDRSAFFAETESDLAKHAQPVAVDAELQVTGLFSSNAWQNPAPLEAARNLLAARYDLEIGLWDLVNNEALRNSLLEEQPLPAAPSGQADLPTGFVTQTLDRVRRGQQERDVLLNQLASELVNDGWTQSVERSDSFIYKLTGEAHAGGDQPAEGLLELNLYVNKQSAAVYIAASTVDLVDQVRETATSAVGILNDFYTDTGLQEIADTSAVWRSGRLNSLLSVSDCVRELRPLWEELFTEPIQAARRLSAAQLDQHSQIRQNAESIAIEVAGLSEGTPSHPVLTAVLTGIADASTFVRAQAVAALQDSFGETARTIVSRMAVEDPAHEVRQAAVEVILLQTPVPVTLFPTLDAVIRSDPDPKTRCAAISGISYRCPRDLIPAVGHALSDDSQLVVAAAINAIEYSRADGFTDQISDLLSATDPSVRVAAVRAIGTLGTGRHVSKLEPLLEDQTAEIRGAALSAIGKLATRPGIPSGPPAKQELLDPQTPPRAINLKAVTAAAEQLPQISANLQSKLNAIGTIRSSPQAAEALAQIGTASTELGELRDAVGDHLRLVEEAIRKGSASPQAKDKLVKIRDLHISLLQKIDQALGSYDATATKIEPLNKPAESRSEPRPPQRPAPRSPQRPTPKPPQRP